MPRFARNDGCEVTGLPCFARNDGCEVTGLPHFARNDGCEITGLPRFPSVARNDEKRGKARLRVGTRVRFLSGGRQGVGTRVKSKKLFFIPSSPMREQEIIIFSVLLAEGQFGLPRFVRNDGCEVTGLPRFARNDGYEVTGLPRFARNDGGEVTGLPRFARNDGRRNVDCSSYFGRLQ